VSHPISHYEAEEMISGKTMTALCKMWPDISIRYQEEDVSGKFRVKCSAHGHTVEGSGETLAFALLEAWIADGK
jgi:hypothetical protein